MIAVVPLWSWSNLWVDTAQFLDLSPVMCIGACVLAWGRHSGLVVQFGFPVKRENIIFSKTPDLYRRKMPQTDHKCVEEHTRSTTSVFAIYPDLDGN